MKKKSKSLKIIVNIIENKFLMKNKKFIKNNKMILIGNINN